MVMVDRDTAHNLDRLLAVIVVVVAVCDDDGDG